MKTKPFTVVGRCMCGCEYPAQVYHVRAKSGERALSNAIKRFEIVEFVAVFNGHLHCLASDAIDQQGAK